MELRYTAVKRSPQEHKFAFAFNSLPDENAEKIDGNDDDGVLDGNAP